MRFWYWLLPFAVIQMAGCGSPDKLGDELPPPELEPFEEPDITKRRLGPNINTNRLEILPIASNDGDTLYFTRAHYVAPETRAKMEQARKEDKDACVETLVALEEADVSNFEEQDRPEVQAILDELRRSTPELCQEVLESHDRRLYNMERVPMPGNVFRAERQKDGSWSKPVRLPPPANEPGKQNWLAPTWFSSVMPDRNAFLLTGMGVIEPALLSGGDTCRSIEVPDETPLPEGTVDEAECKRLNGFTVKKGGESVCQVTPENWNELMKTDPRAAMEQVRFLPFVSRAPNWIRCAHATLIRKVSGAWRRESPVRMLSGPQMDNPIMTSPAIAPSGNVIVFSGFEKGFTDKGRRYVAEQSDLFLIRRRSDGIWTRPVPISAISSEAFESNPFVGPDGKTLYFSSNREGGEGGLDLWMSKRLDDTWQNWSEPVNLGGQINSDEDETSISVDATGRYAFMSAGKGNQQDIYEFGLPPNMRPAPIALVGGIIYGPLGPLIKEDNDHGSVPDWTGGRRDDGGGELDLSGSGNLPVRYGDLGCLDYQAELLSGFATVNPETLEYELSLPVGGRYAIHVETPSGTMGIAEVLDMCEMQMDGEGPDSAGGGKATLNLGFVPLCPGLVIPLNALFFDVDKAELRPESGWELQRFDRVLGQYPGMKVEIAGHTDSTNTETYNQDLSERRAASVYDWLVAGEVNPEQLTTAGYGELEPVATNETPEGRQKNRRVEFRILSIDNPVCRSS